MQVDGMEPFNRMIGLPIRRPVRPERAISGVPTAVAAFVGRAAAGPIDQPVAIRNFSDFQTNFGGLWQGSELGYAVEDFFNNGGQQAYVVRLQNATSESDPLTPADYVPAGGTSTGQGLYALEQVAAFNLLVLPPDRVATGFVDLDPAVVAAAVAYCEQRGALVLIDPPSAWTSVAAAQSGSSTPAATPGGANSSSAALFFPRINKPDPLSGGAVQTFAPGGAVAGVISRTDAAHGVWKSPAGTTATLAGITGVAVAVNDVQNDELQALAVNCLRTFPGLGTVVFGARMLAGPSTGDQFEYIPVRRTAIFLEQSLRAGLAWISFEANNAILWSSIRLEVGLFLQELFAEGAFEGATPEQAYFIKCDAGTTSQTDIAAGIVNTVIGFAPLKPAEFVILSLQLLTGQPPH